MVDRKEWEASEVAKNLVYPEKKKSTDKEKPEVKAKNIRRLASLERSRREIVEEQSEETMSIESHWLWSWTEHCTCGNWLQLCWQG